MWHGRVAPISITNKDGVPPVPRCERLGYPAVVDELTPRRPGTRATRLQEASKEIRSQEARAEEA